MFKGIKPAGCGCICNSIPPYITPVMLLIPSSETKHYYHTCTAVSFSGVNFAGRTDGSLRIRAGKNVPKKYLN